MKTFTANEAKQQLGRVLDTARSGPVTITKHGRPEFVLTSKDDYDSMAELKYQHLKQEIQKGFDEIDRGEYSTRTLEEIAAEAIEIHRKELSAVSDQ
jgi:prevent-host-death family protein